jgi:hypothetical protein
MEGFNTVTGLSHTEFLIFDTDGDGLIDSFELFLTLILLSKADARDKIRFIFEMFDFNDEEFMTIDHLKIACELSK